MQPCLVSFVELNDWFQEKEHTDSITIYLFNKQVGSVDRKTVNYHNSLAGHPNDGHQLVRTLLWDNSPFLNQHLLQVNHCGCTGHSGMNTTPKLIAQVFSGVKVKTASESLHPLHAQIVAVASDEPCSVGVSVVILQVFKGSVWSQNVEICKCHWFQNLILMSVYSDYLQYYQLLFYQLVRCHHIYVTMKHYHTFYTG